jgi:hypothetical protein
MFSALIALRRSFASFAFCHAVATFRIFSIVSSLSSSSLIESSSLTRFNDTTSPLDALGVAPRLISSCFSSSVSLSSIAVDTLAPAATTPTAVLRFSAATTADGTPASAAASRPLSSSHSSCTVS